MDHKRGKRERKESSSTALVILVWFPDPLCKYLACAFSARTRAKYFVFIPHLVSTSKAVMACFTSALEGKCRG